MFPHSPSPSGIKINDNHCSIHRSWHLVLWFAQRNSVAVGSGKLPSSRGISASRSPDTTPVSCSYLRRSCRRRNRAVCRKLRTWHANISLKIRPRPRRYHYRVREALIGKWRDGGKGIVNGVMQNLMYKELKIGSHNLSNLRCCFCKNAFVFIHNIKMSLYQRRRY